MSRARWKSPHIEPTYIRYFFYKHNTKGQHIEAQFFLKNFYYLLLDRNKFIFYNITARSTTILSQLRHQLVRAYRGARWRTFYITGWHVGHKFGEFAKTRQRAVFRAKVLKKKTKSSKTLLLKNLQINRIRLLKSGKIRKRRSVSTSGRIIF